MVNENIKLSGKIQITLNGRVIIEKDNLIVTTGKNFIANAFLNSSTSPFTYMAIGSGTNAPALSDTTLQTEVARQVFGTSNVTGNVVTLVTTYAPGTGTGNVSEAGIFNNVAGGTLYSRVTFSTIAKGALDSVQITWTLTMG